MPSDNEGSGDEVSFKTWPASNVISDGQRLMYLSRGRHGGFGLVQGPLAVKMQPGSCGNDAESHPGFPNPNAVSWLPPRRPHRALPHTRPGLDDKDLGPPLPAGARPPRLPPAGGRCLAGRGWEQGRSSHGGVRRREASTVWGVFTENISRLLFRVLTGLAH